MTGQAERIKAAHRGSRRAEPASQSRMAALESFGLRFERIDDFNVLVEGQYQLNLAMSFWRSSDGLAQGYLVSTLDAEIKKRNPEKPVTGRDSAAADRTASVSTHDVDVAVAESVTGPISSGAGSASLLPAVTP